MKCVGAFTSGVDMAESSSPVPASVQGLTLVHFSAQLKHLSRETLGNFSGSVKNNGSG